MTASLATVTEVLVGPILPSITRQDTPERWAAALERAHAGVHLFAADGRFYATSQRDPSAAYVVTTTSCGCQAAVSGDPVCAHRAGLRAALWVAPFGPLAPR